MKYTITDYFDVWGNPLDGYQVNDARSAGTIDIADNATDADIIRALKERGLLAETAVLNENVCVFNAGESFEICEIMTETVAADWINGGIDEIEWTAGDLITVEDYPLFGLSPIYQEEYA